MSKAYQDHGPPRIDELGLLGCVGNWDGALVTKKKEESQVKGVSPGERGPRMLSGSPAAPPATLCESLSTLLM